MNWPNSPSDRDTETATWWKSEYGGDFWGLVDSTPSSAARYDRCGCHSTAVDPDCTNYAHVRDERQCLAANSILERCSSWVMSGTPFCGMHFKKAWSALTVAALEVQHERHARSLEREREAFDKATSQLFTSLRIERAIKWDAATAASTMKERVYFFRADYAVKIGRSVRPEQRVRTLTGTKSPADVDLTTGVLLGHIPGSSRVEGDLHSRFGRHRLTGEWFEYDPIKVEVAEIIESFGGMAGAA